MAHLPTPIRYLREILSLERVCEKVPCLCVAHQKIAVYQSLLRVLAACLGLWIATPAHATNSTVVQGAQANGSVASVSAVNVGAKKALVVESHHDGTPIPIATTGPVTMAEIVPTSTPAGAAFTLNNATTTQIATASGTNLSLAITNLSNNRQAYLGYVSTVTTGTASYIVPAMGGIILHPQEGATFSLWGISLLGNPIVVVTPIKP